MHPKLFLNSSKGTHRTRDSWLKTLQVQLKGENYFYTLFEMNGKYCPLSRSYYDCCFIRK